MVEPVKHNTVLSSGFVLPFVRLHVHIFPYFMFFREMISQIVSRESIMSTFIPGALKTRYDKERYISHIT